ncbi:hypothetical protein ACFGVR_18900 [Mucilaginibacter sp. AW1-3]
MIIYGSKATHIITEQIAEQCPHCSSANTMHMSVFQRYAHVYWIPMFGIGKTGVSQCLHCKQVLKLKEMPHALKLAYDNVVLRAKTPLFVFSGLAVIAVIVLIAIIK